MYSDNRQHTASTHHGSATKPHSLPACWKMHRSRLHRLWDTVAYLVSSHCLGHRCRWRGVGCLGSTIPGTACGRALCVPILAPRTGVVCAAIACVICCSSVQQCQDCHALPSMMSCMRKCRLGAIDKESVQGKLAKQLLGVSPPAEGTFSACADTSPSSMSISKMCRGVLRCDVDCIIRPISSTQAKPWSLTTARNGDGAPGSHFNLVVSCATECTVPQTC